MSVLALGEVGAHHSLSYHATTFTMSSPCARHRRGYQSPGIAASRYTHWDPWWWAHVQTAKQEARSKQQQAHPVLASCIISGCPPLACGTLCLRRHHSHLA